MMPAPAFADWSINGDTKRRRWPKRQAIRFFGLSLATGTLSLTSNSRLAIPLKSLNVRPTLNNAIIQKSRGGGAILNQDL
jgi:hypothetical protein